jgi:hypothetical protein
MGLVLGITGPNAAGKGEVSAYLKTQGFDVHSLSDIVREEAAALGLPPERAHLIRIGTLLRETGGPRCVGRAIDPTAWSAGRRRLDSESRRGRSAPARSRIPARRRRCAGRTALRAVALPRTAGDPESLAEFKARERQENSENPAGQQLNATFALADRVLQNSGDLRDCTSRSTSSSAVSKRRRGGVGMDDVVRDPFGAQLGERGGSGHEAILDRVTEPADLKALTPTSSRRCAARFAITSWTSFRRRGDISGRASASWS